MSLAKARLTDEQRMEMARGLEALWALAFTHRQTLERLLSFNREMNAYLTLTDCPEWFDFQAVVAYFEPQLVKADLYLQALDAVIARNDINEAELLLYGEKLAHEVNSESVEFLHAKFRQFADTTRALVEKTQAARVLTQIESENRHQHGVNVTQAGYIENGDGTVTDIKTRLMWMQCAEGQAGPQCEGQLQQYMWDMAMALPAQRNQRGGFAGHTDWRLPTAQELHSLVRLDERPTLCSGAFPNAPAVIFWSSTPVAFGAKEVWNVYFGSGSMGRNEAGNSYAVRLVRAAA
jgi:hypothetical protein